VPPLIYLNMITIKSFPANEINETIPYPVTDESAEAVQNIVVDFSDITNDEYVEVEAKGKKYTIVLREECRLKPYDIYFLNKSGAYQIFTMYGRKNDTTKVKREQFYNKNKRIDFGFNVTADFELNTGYITEDLNPTIKEILLSTDIKINEGGVLHKVLITDDSLNFKTRFKDQLISYLFNFTYSEDEV
jgi:hypothetical protein